MGVGEGDLAAPARIAHRTAVQPECEEREDTDQRDAAAVRAVRLGSWGSTTGLPGYRYLENEKDRREIADDLHRFRIDDPDATVGTTGRDPGSAAQPRDVEHRKVEDAGQRLLCIGRGDGHAGCA